MQPYLILLFFINAISSTKLPLPTLKLTAHENAMHITIKPETIARKAKSHLPIAIHLQPQILVPNLHVIPIHSSVHTELNPTLLAHNITNMAHQTQLIPILIPIHNLVPIHDLTVVPLQRVSKPHVVIHVEDEDVNRYRHPFGGYGVGWSFGGHGAGHGFHYSYG